MHVIHLTSSFLFGGPERQMLELARTLRPDCDTAFVSFSEKGRCRQFLDHVRTAGFRGVELSHDFPRLAAACRDLTALLRRQAPDVLFCHGYKANLLGLLAARRVGIPAVAVSRGWTADCRRVRLYEALDRRVLRFMDRVVCVSEAQAQKVRRAGVRPERITVIHNAIRTERFDSPKPDYRDRLRALFPTPPRTIIGAAGRLSPEKGFDVLITAAATVAGTVPVPSASVAGTVPVPSANVAGTRRVPSADASANTQQHTACACYNDASRHSESDGYNEGQRHTACACHNKTDANGSIDVGFVLFGDGPQRDALRRAIAERGLQDRFILAGFRDDLDRYVPHFDVAVLPSHTEGLPNAALEAMAAGVPVVATAVGGTPEVVDHGTTGFLVPRADPAALAAAIERLTAGAPLRRSLGALGRRRVQAHFTFPAQAAAYRTLLGTLCEKEVGGKGGSSFFCEAPSGPFREKSPVPLPAPSPNGTTLYQPRVERRERSERRATLGSEE